MGSEMCIRDRCGTDLNFLLKKIHVKGQEDKNNSQQFMPIGKIHGIFQQKDGAYGENKVDDEWNRNPFPDDVMPINKRVDGQHNDT